MAEGANQKSAGRTCLSRKRAVVEHTLLSGVKSERHLKCVERIVDSAHAAGVVRKFAVMQMPVSRARASTPPPRAAAMRHCRSSRTARPKQGSSPLWAPAPCKALTGTSQSPLPFLASLARFFICCSVGHAHWSVVKAYISGLCQRSWHETRLGCDVTLRPSIISKAVVLLSRLNAALPGSKTTSQYRGVSWNGSVGVWTSMMWNPVTRKAQHIGNYDSEVEVSVLFCASSKAKSIQPGWLHSNRKKMPAMSGTLQTTYSRFFEADSTVTARVFRMTGAEKLQAAVAAGCQSL